MKDLIKEVALDIANKLDPERARLGGDFQFGFNTVQLFAELVVAELSKRAEAVAVYEVGGYYKQLDGNWIQLVGVANEGKEYETMYCKDEIHRYTRQRGGLGRVTGTDHNYTYPLNIPPLFTFPPIHDIAENQRILQEQEEAIENRVAEACIKAIKSIDDGEAPEYSHCLETLGSGEWREYK